MGEGRVCASCRTEKLNRQSCPACGGAGSAEHFLLNCGSAPHLKDVLYNGLKLPRRTRAGKDTTDEEALQSLCALDPTGLVRLMLRHAKLDTMREIYERLAPDADGVVRTVFNPAGTYTGRFSASGAFYWPQSTNLQNLPAAEGARDVLYRVRECIVPQPGHVFLYADLSQAEAKRICAGYHTLHPNLDRVWWDRVQHTLEAERPLVNCFGRVCNFYPRFDPYTGQLDQETLRAAVAWEPQSTVSHLAKLGLL